MASKGFRSVIAARSKAYHATPAQLSYLRRLLHEAFAFRFETAFDVNHLDRVTRAEATLGISSLLAAKKAGWPKASNATPGGD
jgi:hypothetical protein